MNNIVFKSLATIDSYLDYIPLVSTATNLVDIFLKTVYIPSIDDDVILNNHYYRYLENKNINRCLFLLVPFIGNIIILLIDAIPPIIAMNQIHRLLSNELDLSELYLTQLPPKLWKKTGLRNLLLERCRFTTLPAGIGQLTNLNFLSIKSNYLTALPSEIGRLTKLTRLYLDNNDLTSLPPEIGNLTDLTVLDLEKNRYLKELPLSLGQIPNLVEIHIDHTGIDPAIAESILNQCRLMRSDVERILPARLAKWQAIARSSGAFEIGHLSPKQKDTLNEWLFRLEKTKDFAHYQSSLASIVCNIVSSVLTNAEFAELYFSQAEANNECCQDRAAMSLNEIYTSWKLLCSREEQPPLTLLVGVAKTLRLRKELQKLISREKQEIVEIFLYYETQLRERLQLVTAIKTMAYGHIGRRSWINQEQLVKAVEENYIEELIELPLFAKRMKEEWDPLVEECLEKLGDCPEGSEYDEKVLKFKVRQGEIMQELKMKKISAAKSHLAKF